MAGRDLHKQNPQRKLVVIDHRDGQGGHFERAKDLEPPRGLQRPEGVGLSPWLHFNVPNNGVEPDFHVYEYHQLGHQRDFNFKALPLVR